MQVPLQYFCKVILQTPPEIKRLNYIIIPSFLSAWPFQTHKIHLPSGRELPTHRW